MLFLGMDSKREGAFVRKENLSYTRKRGKMPSFPISSK